MTTTPVAGTLATILAAQEASGWSHLPPEVQRTDRERIEQLRGAR